ncbi:hypothetical protein [Halomarina pelagica]|uniref:hypothetical protein n=1 Tax=Halomarina pelagica TaxID=2961599 RepID=UPI0020C366C4|nr:hypothetical protein [Halomarina sp. BND7]
MTTPMPQRRTPEAPADASIADSESEAEVTMEDLIRRLIDERVASLEQEIADLERTLEEVDNFTRISLNERKIKQSQESLSEFSDSLTGFAEKAFNNINELEDRLDTHALLLAAILDALDGEDLDLTHAQRYQEDQLVMNMTPDERLEEAIERSS